MQAFLKKLRFKQRKEENPVNQDLIAPFKILEEDYLYCINYNFTTESLGGSDDHSAKIKRQSPPLSTCIRYRATAIGGEVSFGFKTGIAENIQLLERDAPVR